MSVTPSDFFLLPAHSLHRRYEVLRAFFVDGLSAEAVAERFGYAVGSVYALTRDFRQLDDPAAFFFRPPAPRGRPPLPRHSDLHERIVAMRKRNLSVPEIKAQLDAELDSAPSEPAISRLLREEGFARLPRRSRSARAAAAPPPFRAPESALLDPLACEQFQSEHAAGVLALLPWLRRYGLDHAITSAGYPGTSSLPALQSVLAFTALKLAGARRYSADDLWCMDRGLGLFAGLNVLPKSAWLSSYSDRTTRAMNQRLLGSLARIWTDSALVGDSANLDFTTLPHWGDDDTLQKHWSGTRGRSLTSISALLAQDPDSGLLLQADASIRRESSDNASLEFLHFARRHGPPLRFLVFDSRFTTYRHLDRLDRDDILFVTVRRRGKRLVEQARALAPADLRQVRVPCAQGTRLVQAHDSTVSLPPFDRPLRQITILRGSQRQPVLLLTNDADSSLADLLRRYARRWLVEKSIAEQLAFFHLNRLSSSMVIKVDFDLTITVLAYNLYRLLALDLPPGFRHYTSQTLFEQLLCTAADVRLERERCTVCLKKKRNLPALLEAFQSVPDTRIPWLGDRQLVFDGASRS